MEVQVTNNTKTKVQTNYSLSKNKNAINFSGNTPLIQNKNDTFEVENRLNPRLKEMDNHSNQNLNKEIDFRKITTSPIVIVDNHFN